MDEILIDKLQFYGKRWLARLSLALAIFLMLPTVAIMATWNTLPGEKLYPTKRYLEGIALKLVGNNFTARADLQTQFVEQRFNEAETLLSQSSNSGLNDLAQQIQVTKSDIIAARDRTGGKDTVVAQQKAEKLTIQLKEYNKKLEVSKQTTNNQGSTPSKPPGTTTVSSPKASGNMNNTVVASISPTTPKPTASPVVSPTPVQDSQNIDSVEELQEQIAEVIEELENKKDDKDNKNMKDEIKAKILEEKDKNKDNSKNDD